MARTTLEDHIKGAIEDQMQYFDFSPEEKEAVRGKLFEALALLNDGVAKRVKTKWNKAKKISKQGITKGNRLYP